MATCACGKAASFQCSHHPKQFFCTRLCSSVFEHSCFIDGGIKRERSKTPKPRKREKTKRVVRKEPDVWDVVLHTLRHTPEMLINLANTMTIQQMRKLKKSGKGLYNHIWKNSMFWYYVLKRFRPELVGPVFDQTFAYKQLAMRRLIAPDKTIMDPRADYGFPPQFSAALKLVMTNPSAIDELIKGTDFNTIMNWSRVSREFYRIVHRSNYFWYLFLAKKVLKDTTITYKYNVNYKERLEMDHGHLFKPALRIQLYCDHDIVIDTDEARLYMNGDGTIRDLTMFDVMSLGGLYECLQTLSQFTIQGDVDNYAIEANYRTYQLGKDGGEFETDFEDIPAFSHMIHHIDRYETKMMVGTKTLVIDLHITHYIPFEFKIHLVYPEELEPIYMDESVKTWVNRAYFPSILKSGENRITENIEFFADEALKIHGFDWDYTHDYLKKAFPSRFGYRGGHFQPVENDAWEILITWRDGSKEIWPGAEIDFERLANRIEEDLPTDDEESMTIQIRSTL